EDDLGAKSEEMTLSFTVNDINDAPHLELELTTSTVQEDEGVNFLPDVYYEYWDDDSNPLSVIWNWYVDGVKVPPEQVADKYAYEYVPPITAEKDRTVIVNLTVIDGVHTRGIEWEISVTNLNVKPDVPVFTHDTTITEFKEGEKITFSASGTDLDGDDLTYKWFLDELEEIGTGATVQLTNVKKGPHKITVSVSDGSSTSTADFSFKVKEKKDSSTPGFGAAYVALALIGVVTMMTVLRRRQ
ncbi:MAG: PKD domain-containing protein, partial [Candidatus Thermoplasmatota archaeon]|nr:PKD domain-containing protein [Candidatus Thermoplasmatota archaeon]